MMGFAVDCFVAPLLAMTGFSMSLRAEGEAIHFVIKKIYTPYKK